MLVKHQGASTYSLVNNLNKEIIDGMQVLDVKQVLVPKYLLNSVGQSVIKNLYQVEFKEANTLGYFYIRGDGKYYYK
jgi:hypothetical protein